MRSVIGDMHLSIIINIYQVPLLLLTATTTVYLVCICYKKQFPGQPWYSFCRLCRRSSADKARRTDISIGVMVDPIGVSACMGADYLLFVCGSCTFHVFFRLPAH